MSKQLSIIVNCVHQLVTKLIMRITIMIIVKKIVVVIKMMMVMKI